MEGKSAVLSGDMISGRKMLISFIKSKDGRNGLKVKALFLLLKSMF